MAKSEEPFDWHKPPTDVHGNVITADDPRYEEKLLEAMGNRFERDLRASGINELLEDRDRRRSSPDINERLSTAHTLQQKAKITLEAFDATALGGNVTEVVAAVTGLKKIADTPIGVKPKPLAYEIYESLRQVAQEASKKEPTGHAAKQINDFTSVLVQNDLISTSPHRVRV